LLTKRSMALWSADGVGEGGEPFVGPPIKGDDDGAGAVSFGEDVVGVAAFLGVHGVEAEAVGMRRSTPTSRRSSCSWELLRRAWRMALRALSMGTVRTEWPRRQAMWPRAWAREGLSDADGADDEDAVMGVEEAQRGELVEGGLVEGDLAVGS
jgi:hypothetical protein